jgi:hypothetical protein
VLTKYTGSLTSAEASQGLAVPEVGVLKNLVALQGGRGLRSTILRSLAILEVSQDPRSVVD